MAGVLRQFFALADQFSRDFSTPEMLQADLILNQLPGGLYGWDLAEKLGIPMRALTYLPLLGTKSYPMIGFPRRLAFLPGYNRLTYRLAEQAAWLFFRAAINRWRRETLGLPAQPLSGQLHQLGSPACPVLLGLSPQLFPPQPDWPALVTQTGYWYPQDPAWQPSLELLKFINQSLPPIFIGFGSMPVRRTDAILDVILSALRQTGQRAVLQAGWAQTALTRLPENVFALDFAPYDWLFPRMAGLVIHGGAGTVHFALRSGTPVLVTPFLFDQFVWGRRLAELGAGPPPLPFRRLSAPRLADALQRLVGDPAYAHNAARLGGLVQAEPGTAGAVRAIAAI